MGGSSFYAPSRQTRQFGFYGGSTYTIVPGLHIGMDVRGGTVPAMVGGRVVRRVFSGSIGRGVVLTRGCLVRAGITRIGILRMTGCLGRVSGLVRVSVWVVPRVARRRCPSRTRIGLAGLGWVSTVMWLLVGTRIRGTCWWRVTGR